MINTYYSELIEHFKQAEFVSCKKFHVVDYKTVF